MKCYLRNDVNVHSSRFTTTQPTTTHANYRHAQVHYLPQTNLIIVAARRGVGDGPCGLLPCLEVRGGQHLDHRRNHLMVDDLRLYDDCTWAGHEIECESEYVKEFQHDAMRMGMRVDMLGM